MINRRRTGGRSIHQDPTLREQDDVADQLISLLSLAAAPLLTALFAGGTIVLRDWRLDRNQAHRLQVALDRATRELAFLDTWSRATSPLLDADDLQSSRQEMRRDLDRVRSDVRSATDPPTGQPAPPRHWREYLLLEPMTTWWLRTLQVAHHLYVVASTCLAVVLAFVVDSDPGSRWHALFVRALSIAFVLAPVAVSWKVLHELAERHPRAEPDLDPPPSHASVLLARPLEVGPSPRP